MQSGGFYNQSPEKDELAQLANQNANQASESKTEKRMQTIIPATIKMLLESQMNGDKIELDGIQISNIVVVGRITKTQEEGNRILVTIADSTGQITTQITKKNNTKPLYLQNVEFSENIYIRAVMYESTFKEQKVHYCQQIQVITDFNEVTKHYLEVILRHCQRTQGIKKKVEPIQDNQQKKQQLNPINQENPQLKQQLQQQQLKLQQQPMKNQVINQNQNQNQNQANLNNNNQNPSLDIEQQILEFIKNNQVQNPNGSVHIQQIAAHFKNINLISLKNILNNLLDNSLVFSVTQDQFCVG